MASYTYLQLVNQVLRRLRETEVSSVQDNSYSKLIGDFVNDAKRQTEDSYNWNALKNTLTVNTVNAVFSYGLTSSGQRFKIIDVLNDSDDYPLRPQTTTEMNRLLSLTDSANAKGSPRYYNFNGTDENGDTLVDIYPIPDKAYTLRFNIIHPQDILSADTDVLLIPSEPVIFGALARAQAERGEDGGIVSGEMIQLYRQSLSDAIALEASRTFEESQWISN